VNKTKLDKPKSSSAEPFFYIALVLRGSEEQYLELLKHVNTKNGAQIIYQCKSLTYLRVARDDRHNVALATEFPSALEISRVESK
jgi:hypothetical protein